MSYAPVNFQLVWDVFKNTDIGFYVLGTSEIP